MRVYTTLLIQMYLLNFFHQFKKKSRHPGSALRTFSMPDVSVWHKSVFEQEHASITRALRDVWFDGVNDAQLVVVVDHYGLALLEPLGVECSLHFQVK